MGQFVLAAWSSGAEPPLVGGLRAAAELQGWRTLLLRDGLWVAGGGPRPPRLQSVQEGRVLVVGDLHPRPGSGAPGSVGPGPGASPEVRCRRLSDGGWGRYVGLLLDASGSLEALFRDPSGAWDCAVWRGDGMIFAASASPDWLLRALRPRWSMDWTILADILADPVLLSADPPLQGVQALAPGEVRSLRSRTRGALVWTPAGAARAAPSEPKPARARLRTALDAVVQSASAGSSGLLVEVSGGLDSAIVASSLKAGGRLDRTVWRNSRGPYTEADEGRYAQALAAHLGVPLQTFERPEPVGFEALCLEHPASFRPSVNRLDPIYDADQAAACRAGGLDAIVTGKGGDVVFFQTATSAVLADLIADRGLRALADPAALVLARRLRRSLWSVLGRALRVRGRPLRRAPLDLVAPEVRARRPPAHPWLEDIDDLPLGKRIQIAGFANNLGLHGLSRRTEAADLFHPILTQPVMEACLAVPTYGLTEGGHDRLLARSAFGDRLPQAILRRRSKGELGVYYGRSIAAGLEPLRAHLLDGRLAGAGLLDRGGVEAALELDTLMWRGGYGDVMLLALLESWARAWD